MIRLKSDKRRNFCSKVQILKFQPDHLKKALKIALRILIVVIILILILFIGGKIYLKQHKKQVISLIEIEAKKELNGGELYIADINIGFYHSFPRFAFTIDSLSLRDSLWSHHHHDLISATRVYATMDLFKLIFGKISIDRVQLENPHIYLYTDTSGYSNTSIFKKKAPPKKNLDKNFEYPILQVSNGNLIIDKKDNNKIFVFEIPNLETRVNTNEEDPGLKINIALHCIIRQMTFNKQKGPFLEGKTVAGNFKIEFNKDSKVLQFVKIRLDVDKQPFTFTGKFFLAEVPAPFKLSWETENMSFRKAASFLSKNIRIKLEPYDISESISHLTGSIDNTEPEYKTPLIHLRLQVENKTIATPITIINNASFTATFNNEEIKGQGHEDENTIMHFSSMKGRWDKLDFHCDSIVIRNLIHPQMNLNLLSDFPLENINNVFDENILAFSNGYGKINVVYSGSLEQNYDSLRMIHGNFDMDSASIIYVPRNLKFTDGKGNVHFTGKDMIVDNLNLNTGSTDLIMNGSAKNLFYIINQENKKLVLDWTIRSNKLNLNDFISFLKQKHSKVFSKKKKSSLDRSLTNFTNLLESANFNLNLNARQLIYKKFFANNISANMEMNENVINMKKIQLQHANGNIIMEGILRNESSSNPFSFKAQLRNINVSKIFAAFNNFGLKSPTDKNIGGILSADVTMDGGVNTNAQLIPGELKGFVKFNLQNGQLTNFEPIQKISQTIFKSRNFSDIQFADLHDLLEINGQSITVNRMEIRSSVLTMFVEGIYNMKKGPDLSIQVPLSNLKANKDSVLTNKGIFSKTGPSARLRAKWDDNNKIKITWDPFNKSGKAIKARNHKPKI
jgi:AsmA-like C-terminal region